MFVFFLSFSLSKSVSILLCSSLGFSDYRHMTDLFIFYNTLHMYNKNPTILNYFPQDIFKDKRNIKPSYVFLDDTKYLKYTDLIPKGHSPNDFLNGIRCHIPELKYINKNDNVFIYMTGHGCKGVFKFYDKEWLSKEDLMYSIKILCKRVNKVLLIIDTCSAESMVSRDIDNLYIVSTSGIDEPSYSYTSNKKLGINTVDHFPYYFYKVFKDVNKVFKDVKELSLNELFDRINENDLKSNLTYSDKKSFLVKDFFV